MLICANFWQDDVEVHSFEFFFQDPGARLCSAFGGKELACVQDFESSEVAWI